MTHHEAHKSHRSAWLRASVLGANDGIVSTASLIIGVASASASQESILLAGAAGLVAGAMSMAAGEYVSVSSQQDIEKADLAQEEASINEDYEFEKRELAEIYQQRGLEVDLSFEVAKQLMAHDALGSHARDEIGISENASANPIQAAISSGISFTVGAALPLVVAWFFSGEKLITSVSLLSLVFLALLGGLAAKAGGAPILQGVIRVTFWGAFAMLLTAGVGSLFGVVT